MKTLSFISLPLNICEEHKFGHLHRRKAILMCCQLCSRCSPSRSQQTGSLIHSCFHRIDKDLDSLQDFRQLRFCFLYRSLGSLFTTWENAPTRVSEGRPQGFHHPALLSCPQGGSGEPPWFSCWMSQNFVYHSYCVFFGFHFFIRCRDIPFLCKWQG